MLITVLTSVGPTSSPQCSSAIHLKTGNIILKSHNGRLGKTSISIWPECCTHPNVLRKDTKNKKDCMHFNIWKNNTELITGNDKIINAKKK